MMLQDFQAFKLDRISFNLKNGELKIFERQLWFLKLDKLLEKISIEIV